MFQLVTVFFDRVVVTTKIRGIVTKPLLFRYDSPVTTKMSKKNRDEFQPSHFFYSRKLPLLYFTFEGEFTH